MSALTYNPSDKLEDQAANAALYPTQDSPSKRSSASILDEDGRLSSASAAQSLKYARAQELPSYPSTGGVKLASAGAAASLADSNKKQFEHWKPGTLPAANQAAYRAKDYEMDPAWKPELSHAGSQAAMAAHKDTAPVDVWTAPETEDGASAATSAVQNKKSPPAITNREVSTDNRHKALLAATESMSRGRRRAESAPIRPSQPPPQASSAGWALKAAESSHQKKPSDAAPPVTAELSGFDAARVQNMARNNVSRQMYTSNPPVAIEVEEKNRQDTLRASALAMARKMYAIQQAQIDEAKGVHRSDSHYAAYTARRRAQSDAANRAAATKDEPPPRYENLEEAARKLAHERLAKLHDEHAEYRQYYGQQIPPPRSRLTLRRGRRTSSLQEDSDSDEEQSRKIRAQMSLFQGKLADVDNKKRQSDRDALLAIAHKNVTARMNAIDEKVFSETGKTSAQQREIWERQARERAQRESDERLIHAGKVHIGGGRYLDQSEIDEIAKARLQPTLDEITEKAEQHRARDEEIRLEQERLKAEQMTEKQRQAEIKAEQKAAAEREKAEARAQKAEEKRTQQEQKAAEKKAREEAAARQRAERDEKRQSGSGKPRLLPSFLASRGGAGAGAATGTVAAEVEEPVGDTVHDKVTHDHGEGDHAHVALKADEENDSMHHKQPEEEAAKDAPLAAKEDTFGTLETKADQSHEPKSPTSPASPSKRDSRVKSWFKRIRGGSRPENDFGEKSEAAGPQYGSYGAGVAAESDKNTEEDKPRSESIRDVALAGRTDNESDDLYGAASSKSDGRVSPIQDEPTGLGTGSGAAIEAGSHKALSISSASDTSVLSEEPHVIAADVASPGYAEDDESKRVGADMASSRYSEERPADVASSRYSEDHESKRDSGVDQLGAVSDTESEPRGRKGFAERFLANFIPSSLTHKEKEKEKRKLTADEGEAETEKEPHTNPDPKVLAETEPLREKIQDPATADTGDDDEEDFEEARDTFDEQRLGPPAKLVDVKSTETPRLVDVGSPSNKKPSSSPAGSRTSNTTGGREGSRFTEEL